VCNDQNHDGIQDAGEPGLPLVRVFLYDSSDMETVQTETDAGGFYLFEVPGGSYQVSVQVPTNYLASPADQGVDDTVDSDGVADTLGFSVAPGFALEGEAAENPNTDFGFYMPSLPYTNPGTGTPGYWKNHPDAWPVQSITVGGVTYSKSTAIALLGKVGKDKSITMFSSLVPAMLNVMIGNDSSCVATTIAAANDWMATYGPAGSNVKASSAAWAQGEPLHQQMDAYNNGLLCAPHRN
jgi:hypothetical protein